jgi:cytochrome c biogenesis protein CcmG/thiol:disulfide interchange protein DsbE
MKNWTKLALLALAAVVATRLIFRRAEWSGAVGQPAPPLVLPDLGGRPVDLADYRGRVVAVNFWASWCGPCRMELPALSAVWREHQGRCFELLGVAEESAREDVAAISRVLPYPVLFDASAAALGPWDVNGYPRTYLVDAEGKIRRVFRGALAKEELARAIAPLLPSSCPARSG